MIFLVICGYFIILSSVVLTLNLTGMYMCIFFLDIIFIFNCIFMFY